MRSSLGYEPLVGTSVRGERQLHASYQSHVGSHNGNEEVQSRLQGL